MFKYPCLSIDLTVIESNTRNLIQLCKERGVDPVGITKLTCGAPEVAQAMIAGGISIIGDSRIENLKKQKNIPIKKMLLRLPAISEAREVVRYADISLNSEQNTLQALSDIAVEENKIHEIIIMHDLGDLREGCFNKEDTFQLARKVLSLPGLKLTGIGSNLACYGGVEPTNKNQNDLIHIAEDIEKDLNIKFSVISGASSSGLFLLAAGELPARINQLRLGASLIMGIGLNDDPIPETSQQAMKLQVEVIEIKEKPSVPINSTALDAFGNKPVFVDRGDRKRAICAIGKQDIDISEITPDDEDIIVIGGSSDHLILDISDSKENHNVGGIISFSLSYGGVLQCMTSEFVHKNYICK
ncbi:alanine/ornithine racemase family PLP-dependent enzyme [Photobacterium lipolyticum]|uniref:Alanine racemase n=1 Tax=Photobacterium lipolyticum TaxID=266810 RepID=A0A2T3MVX7_9GAMM|nr:alanine/ornithine racemase family PLP-dependent enzyme [Photobacterium lipolyticum]PSW04090.1 alanine racemase [Photobacterium lipolyticum]